MKQKFGSIIVDGSGKLGGTDIMHNGSSSVMRSRSLPRNRNSSSQHSQRGIFRSIQSSWRNLTQDQRNTWISAAKTRVFHSPKGGEFHYSGLQLYSHCNMNLLSVGQSTISDFVNAYITNQPNFSYAHFDSLYYRLLIALDDTIPADCSLVIYASRPVSKGVTVSPKSFKRIFYSDSNIQSVFDITSYYTSVFGDFDLSSFNVFFKIEFISNLSGLRSSPSILDLNSSISFTSSFLFNGVSQLSFQYTLPSGYSITFDWGDGSSTVISGGAGFSSINSNYSGSSKTYKVRIFGDIDHLSNFRSSSFRLQFDISCLLIFYRAPLLLFYSSLLFGDITLLYYRSNYSFLSFVYSPALFGDVSLFLAIPNIVRCAFTDSSGFTYTSRSLSFSDGDVISFKDNSWPSAYVDQVIIDCSSVSCTGKALHLDGSNAARTSASDAAKALWLSNGNTIYVNE